MEEFLFEDPLSGLKGSYFVNTNRGIPVTTTYQTITQDFGSILFTSIKT
jgi:hypothetical protein